MTTGCVPNSELSRPSTGHDSGLRRRIEGALPQGNGARFSTRSGARPRAAPRGPEGLAVRVDAVAPAAILRLVLGVLAGAAAAVGLAGLFRKQVHGVGGLTLEPGRVQAFSLSPPNPHAERMLNTRKCLALGRFNKQRPQDPFSRSGANQGLGARRAEEALRSAAALEFGQHELRHRFQRVEHALPGPCLSLEVRNVHRVDQRA